MQAFIKGYLPIWTEEIFTVEANVMIQPSTYKLHNNTGESIEGLLYDWELQKIVKKDDIFIIEEIMVVRKTRAS